MSNYNKITALYSRLSVGDEDRDGGESNSIQNQKSFWRTATLLAVPSAMSLGSRTPLTHSLTRCLVSPAARAICDCRIPRSSSISANVIRSASPPGIRASRRTAPATPAGIECPDNPAANAPSAMTSEHNPSLSFMMSHAIGWEPGLPDSWDIRKALSSPPAPPPWRPARFGLPVEGNHHRGYGCYDRPEPGEKFARRLQQLRDLLHVHLLSLPTPPL